MVKVSEWNDMDYALYIFPNLSIVFSSHMVDILSASLISNIILFASSFVRCSSKSIIA